jgi:beta-mannosidase
VRDTARVRLGRFAGPPLREHAVAFQLAARESRCVAHWAAGELPGAADRYLWASSEGGRFGANRHFFAAIKDLDRPRPRVRHSVEPGGDGRLHVRLRTDAYAYFVHVRTPDERVRADDNYVELEPGGERVITLDGGGTPLRPEDVDVRAR